MQRHVRAFVCVLSISAGLVKSAWAQGTACVFRVVSRRAAPARERQLMSLAVRGQAIRTRGTRPNAPQLQQRGSGSLPWALRAFRPCCGLLSVLPSIPPCVQLGATPSGLLISSLPLHCIQRCVAGVVGSLARGSNWGSSTAAQLDPLAPSMAAEDGVPPARRCAPSPCPFCSVSHTTLSVQITLERQP